MKVLSGVIVGLFSGFLIYMMAAMLAGGAPITADFVFFTFIGGWALSTFFVLKGSTTASKVWARGGLLGAAEWMLVGLSTLVYSGKTLGDMGAYKAGSAQTGAVLGAGLFSMMGVGLAVFMSFPCLIVYFIASRSPKEFEHEIVRIKCPECAESIAADARKCRFCGNPLNT